MTNRIFSTFKENKLLKFMLFYGVFYLIGFFWLESREIELNMVYSKWDSFIPFCEYFVIPYFSWFVYMLFTFIYIILSTLFLKQHSVVDVIYALLLNVVCYIGIYKFNI